MDHVNTPQGEPRAPGGLSSAAKFGLWSCGGCAVALSAVIIVGGVLTARFLRQHPDSLQKMYEGDTTPVLMEQPGGFVRTVSAEWNPMSVAWSPDGQRVAICALPKMAMGKLLQKPPPMMFDPRRGGEEGMRWALGVMGPRVVIIDLASGEEQTIYPSSAEVMETPEEIVWFPDGQRLAIVTSPVPIDYSAEEPRAPRLWMLNADGSSLRKIAEEARNPVISPDGQWIAYRRYTPGSKVHPLEILPVDGGAEIPIWEQSVGEVTWDKTGKVLYFRPYENQWRRVQLPQGTVETVPMQLVENRRRTTLASEELIGYHGFAVGEPYEKERHRLFAANLSDGQVHPVSPYFSTPAMVLGTCLGGRYILLDSRTTPEGEYGLWVYRLADNKFYQVTDDPDLKTVWGPGSDCIAPSGEQVCLTYGGTGPEPWQMFTSGFSMPLMLLQLDEKKILSQPGQDEPVVSSPENQGATP